MPPKKKTEQKKFLEEEYQSSSQDKGKGKRKAKNRTAQGPIQCKCGKKYGTLAAVYTHINNKHKDEKAQFKKGIINPDKKTEGAKNPAIRTKDIKHNQAQSSLMTAADKVVKNIYDIEKVRQEYKQRQNLILEQSDSDEEIEDTPDVIIVPSGRHRDDILRLIRQKCLTHNIWQEIQLNMQSNQLAENQTFKQEKFNLNMRHQVVKYFTVDLAWKILLQLDINIIKRYNHDGELNKRLDKCAQQLWEPNQLKIPLLLAEYVMNWDLIRRREGKQIKKSEGRKK